MTLYHGGIVGLCVGDQVVPARAHVVDGCPICVARASGRSCTVGEYRRWLLMQGPAAAPLLNKLVGVPSSAPMDPPSERVAVYVTTEHRYARWYAAKAGNGDLYRVDPVGPLTPSVTDHFPSWTCDAAMVVAVVERRVVLDRRFRRDLERAWRKADLAADRRRLGGGA